MLSHHQALVEAYTRDDAGRLTETERDRAIALAVGHYSHDRPREISEDVATTGANLCPLPTGWRAEFSQIRAIEYPLSQVPPSLLDADRYAIYRAPSGLAIQLYDALAIGTTIRVTYTAPHQVDSSADTVPEIEREVVACWAAAALCDQLAALYSGGSDATIQADSVQSADRAREYSARARDLRKRYAAAIGVPAESRTQGASAYANWNANLQDGADRLTHSRRFR